MGGRHGTFTHAGPTRYLMEVPEYELTFDLDRLRRERYELWGELLVRCSLKGAKTIDGILSAADFNLSGQQSRVTRAKYLAERAAAPEIDFQLLLEEFCQRVIAFDREGGDAPRLKDLPCPEKGDGWMIDGLTLLERHPMILFGDGGQGKSLLALYLVGRLAKRGLRVLYCDWEFDGESHRQRYEALFGAETPATIRYVRCDRPLGLEADRLRRLVEQYDIQYLVCDSIVFACGPGVPAESAEAAATYFQALRQIGIGSLNLAHTTKQGSDQDEKRQQAKPFGSVFWANGARATWFLKGDNDVPGRLAVSLLQRKSNLGPLSAPLGWTLEFKDDLILVDRLTVADHPTLGKALRIRDRLTHALSHGAATAAALAQSLEVPVDSVRKAADRDPERFVKVTGEDGILRYGLATRVQ